ncbi:MAG TPA: WhiB family transcriptional regulator [Streptosporangiaceae bacterium]|jgi:hypothetical protein
MSDRPWALVRDAAARGRDLGRFDVLAAGADCLFDPELHDSPGDQVEAAPDRAAREAVAVEVCEDCPMLAACRRYVADVQPVSGVWAALTPDDRAAPAHPLELAEVA